MNKKWKRHLERLSQKKAPDEFGRYEIKTPIPSHPDRCFVCQGPIPPGVDYKEHLRSVEHLNYVERDPLYREIDDILDELNFKQEMKGQEAAEKKKRPRRRGAINKGGVAPQLAEFVILEVTEDEASVNNDNVINCREKENCDLQ